MMCLKKILAFLPIFIDSNLFKFKFQLCHLKIKAKMPYVSNDLIFIYRSLSREEPQLHIPQDSGSGSEQLLYLKKKKHKIGVLIKKIKFCTI
jgi:hypothetical protein